MIPILCAIAAAAWVWWSNRPAGKVPPIPSPGGLPAFPGAPAAPAAGGTSPLLVAAILLPWALLAWSATARPTPKPDPAPAPAPAGIDLRGVWVGPTAADDAAITGELLESLAGQLEYDGTLATPRITTGAQAAELRRLAREYRTLGVSLASRQPAAIERIASYFDDSIGDDGGDIDAAGRRRWVDSYRVVSRACREAVR